LREGYNVAGIHQTRTTRQQRAIGFVMATFQKVMSSSPRAIRQALRRRLLVLLVRKQLSLEARRRSGAATSDAILTLQDEMLHLVQEIFGEKATNNSDGEAYVSQVRWRGEKASIFRLVIFCLIMISPGIPWPWSTRIGRIHRYGQEETVQVYNPRIGSWLRIQLKNKSMDYSNISWPISPGRLGRQTIEEAHWKIFEVTSWDI